MWPTIPPESLHVHRLASRYLIPAALVMLAYGLAMVATFALLMPLQLKVLPEYANHASLLFLPHGVRVLTAWLYRWRSVILLLPASLAGHVYLDGFDFALSELLASLAGVVCAVMVFEALLRLGVDLYPAKSKRVHWLELALVGGLASIINGIGTALFYGNDLTTASARFLGDVTGVVASLFLLVVFVRFAERLARA